MLFFFILPVWVVLVLSGAFLLFVPRYRKLGWYAISVSTTAVLTAFLLSTAVLYFGAWIGPRADTKWLGIALIGTYLFALGGGIVLGGVAGFLLVRRMNRV